jgi:ABC-2 type transport system ATP-binding protein
VLGEYRRSIEGSAAQRPLDGLLRVREVEVGSAEGAGVRTGGPLDVSFLVESDEEYRAWIYLGVSEGAAAPIFLVNPGREVIVGPVDTRVSCTVLNLPLPFGRYYLWGAAFRNWTNGQQLLGWQPLAQFDVYGPDLDTAPRAIARLSPVHVESQWKIGPGADD